MKRYGTPTPYIYDLKSIKKVPVAMFVGKQDEISHPLDVKWAWDQITSKAEDGYQEFEDCDHFSFAFGKDTSPYMKKTIEIIQKYNK
jgi:alpha-beta hydrolase superfamily lysophospholipase